MKVLASLCLIVMIIALACNNPNMKETAQLEGTKKEVLKNFSDSLVADTFIVKIVGTKLNSQKLDFKIISQKGAILYHREISSSDILNNYDATIDLKKNKNKARFLESEIARFLDDENFMEPAITDNETPDNNVPDTAFYEELKASGLNGFSYRLGKEEKIYIGWSAKENKVKIYYNCCK